MTILRILLWFGGSVLAIFVALSSMVIANQVKRPGVSYELGAPPTGTAAGNLAFASYATRQRENPKAAVSRRERSLAAEAYRSEPLSSPALGILIAAMPRDGRDAGVRQALLDIGGKLTRRSSLITSASVEAAAFRNDEDAFFLWLSRAILTNEGLRTIYIRAMAQATARPGAEEALARIIGPNPNWANRYWGAVVSVPESLENAVRLRVLIAKAPWRQTGISETDRGLSSILVKRGKFDAARQLAIGLGVVASSPADGRNLLTNGGFERLPALPPIDWQLATVGNLGASIAPQGKKLVVSAISGAHGYAARQLVHLQPGSYELGWMLTANAPMEKGALAARLTCAERAGQGDVVSVDLDAGTHASPMSVPAGACNWYWFSLDANVPDQGSGFDAELRSISLTSRAGQAAPAASREATAKNMAPGITALPQ